MEANLCNNERNTAEDSNDNGCLRRNYHPITQSPSMVRHVRTMECNLACNEPEISEQIEPQVGNFYEVDHTKLPPRSPIQLKSIRIVMVTEKTELNVSVKFPSTLSLRTYFNKDSSNGSSQDLAGKVQPSLDEQFVMGSRLARKVLSRLVSPSELLKQKHLQSFWLVPLKTNENFSSDAKEGLVNDPIVKGTCWSALKCEGDVHWGVRRRVTFIGRHKDKTPLPFFASVREGKEEEKEKEEDEEEQEEDAMETKTEETKERTRKRKHESSNWIRKAQSARKRERGKLRGCNGSKKMKPLNGSKDRWSAERYDLAEQKLLEIMKEKGAVVGQPMLRPALRQEARKHIGDTGLLDHLLKHMAGKVAPGGIERFRRRHNPEGAMEYWLESAELVNIRKEAGVNDPYWFPPPGWKPGDSPSQHAVCTRELNLLKEEMATLKREVQGLLSKKQQEEERKIATVATDDANVAEEINAASRSHVEDNNLQSESATVATWQEMYENMVKMKGQLEQQLVEFSNSLKEMQEQLGKQSSCSMDEETERSTVVVVEEGEEEEKRKGAKGMDAAADAEKRDADKEEEEGKAADAAKAERRQRLRSGFRICKPQGTFLWPNMVGSGGSNMLSSPLHPPHAPHSQVAAEDTVPTPPSASSTTSAPRLPININVAPPMLHITNPIPIPRHSISGVSTNSSHPQQPSPSPVKPLAEKRGFTLAVSSAVVIPESTCQGDNISPTPTSVRPRLNLDLDDVIGSDHDVAVVSCASTKMTSGADDLIRHYHHQQEHGQQQYHQGSYCASSVGTWLALSTSNSYSDCPNRG